MESSSADLHAHFTGTQATQPATSSRVDCIHSGINDVAGGVELRLKSPRSITGYINTRRALKSRKVIPIKVIGVTSQPPSLRQFYGCCVRFGAKSGVNA